MLKNLEGKPVKQYGPPALTRNDYIGIRYFAAPVELGNDNPDKVEDDKPADGVETPNVEDDKVNENESDNEAPKDEETPDSEEDKDGKKDEELKTLEDFKAAYEKGLEDAKKIRSENASRRVALKEKETQLQEKEQLLTEATQKIEELTQEIATFKDEATKGEKISLLKAAGLPESFTKFLTADTKEEWEETIKELSGGVNQSPSNRNKIETPISAGNDKKKTPSGKDMYKKVAGIK